MHVALGRVEHRCIRYDEEWITMSWHMEGTYFENCNCNVICPCTWSGFGQPATHDRCTAFLAFHVEDGEVDGTDVSGRSFAMVIDAPALMGEGNWRVGVLLDDGADATQVDAFHHVLTGELGGPPAVLTPLISELLGLEQVPVTFEEVDGQHRARFGASNVGVDDLHATEDQDAVRLVNVFHPANDTLTMTRGVGSKIDAFGIAYDGDGTSGFAAPFAWAG